MKAETSSFLIAAAPFLRDLGRWHPGLLRIEPTPDDPDWSGVVWDSSGLRTGVYCSFGVEAQEAAAELADVLQESAIEGLWHVGAATNWPPCPEHPDRHPLVAALRDGTAAWACPSTSVLVAQIGELAAPDRA